MTKTLNKAGKKKPGPKDHKHLNKSQKHEIRYKRKTKPRVWGDGAGT